MARVPHSIWNQPLFCFLVFIALSANHFSTLAKVKGWHDVCLVRSLCCSRTMYWNILTWDFRWVSLILHFRSQVCSRYNLVKRISFSRATKKFLQDRNWERLVSSSGPLKNSDRRTLESWSRVKLKETSIYGVCSLDTTYFWRQHYWKRYRKLFIILTN